MLEQGFKPQAQTDGTYVLEWMKDTTQCATEIDAQDSSVAPRTCVESDAQKWEIGSHKWASPVFTWVEMGCGQGVETSYAYTESYTYVDSEGVVSEANSELIDAAKQSLFDNASLPNTVTVRQQDVTGLSGDYAQMMYHPSDASIDRSHLFTCGVEASCMYRSVMTMHNASLQADLKWVTGYTKCLDSAPVCVPLTEYDSTTSECLA